MSLCAHPLCILLGVMLLNGDDFIDVMSVSVRSSSLYSSECDAVEW